MTKIAVSPSATLRAAREPRLGAACLHILYTKEDSLASLKQILLGTPCYTTARLTVVQDGRDLSFTPPQSERPNPPAQGPPIS